MKTTVNSSDGTTKLGDGLGKDSFLQLLMTQMRYQDPMSPADSTESIAQLAQFNTLEQMQNLNDSFTKMLKWSQMTEASGLIGKKIEAIVSKGVDKDNDGKVDTANVSGVVSQVNYVNGEPRLIVAGQEIQLSDVTKIFPQPETVSTQTASDTENDDTSTESA
jgi:flagellar basal-body rod modification protein FlgD